TLPAALAVLFGTARAHAQTDDVDALLRRGVALRERGDDDAALRVFQRACALRCTPRVTAQVGLAEDALGRWVDAESHLTAAVGATDDFWIARHHSALVGALATVRQHLGTLEIRGPAGAMVSVGGRPVGTLPLA